MHTQGADQGGGHVPAADLDLAAGEEPAHAPAPPHGDAQALEERVNEMQHQLQYAIMVRANYEKQLHQLASALQAERISKGENNLRVHELSEQVRELSKVKQELHDQVEHWKFRAQEALEHKALDVMTADQNQVTSATEDILLDIKKLQQSEAYWRQQAKTLVHDYEEAEGDIRKMIRELQRDREKLRGKEAAEQKLREEVDFLQKALRSIASTRDSQSSEFSIHTSTYKSSERNDNHPAETALQDGGHSYLQWQTQGNGESHLHESSRNGPTAPNWGGPGLHSTHNSSMSAVGNPQRPAPVRAGPPPAPPGSQPPDLHGFNDVMASHPTSHSSSKADAIYSSSSSSHRNNSRFGGSVPAFESTAVPDFDKVVQLQMELLRQGRYEEAEKLSLQFSFEELSVNQTERSIPDVRGVEANRVEHVANPLAQTDSAWDGHAHQLPMQRKIGPSATRAAAPLSLRSAGDVQGAGYSVIGEPSQVQLGEPYKKEDRPRTLRIDDLQDQGSPVPPPLPSQPQTDITRTNSTSPPLHEKLALENKLATLEVIHHMNVPQSAGGEPWTVRAGQNSSPLTVVDGALQITAMDRTSLVEAQEVTKWNETITLTDMHPSDVHIAQQPGAHQLPDQDGPELDGRPTLLFVSIHTLDGQRVQQAGRTAVLIQGECAHTQSFTLLHSNGTPILHQSGQPATIQMQYSYSPASRAQDTDKLLPPLGEDTQNRSRSKSTSRMARHSRQRSATPGKNTDEGEEGTPQISAMLGFFSGSASSLHGGETPGQTSGRSSQQGGHGPTEPHLEFETAAPRAQRSAARLPAQRVTDLDNASGSGSVEQRTKSDSTRGERASNASASLGTSQSSTVSMTLESADRPSPKVSPKHTPRKSPKSRKDLKPSGAMRNAEASASQSVEVHIVRQTSKDQPSAKSRVGIGISFGVTRSGEIFITGLSPKGSAKASGKVREGDQLLAVDGVEIKGYQVKEIVQLILGKPGTKVSLQIIPAAVEIPASLGHLSSLPSAVKQQELKQPEVKPPEPVPKDHEEMPNPTSVHTPVKDKAGPNASNTRTSPTHSTPDVRTSPSMEQLDGNMTQAQWARRQLAKMGTGFSHQVNPKRDSA